MKVKFKKNPSPPNYIVVEIGGVKQSISVVALTFDELKEYISLWEYFLVNKWEQGSGNDYKLSEEISESEAWDELGDDLYTEIFNYKIHPGSSIKEAVKSFLSNQKSKFHITKK